MCNCLWGTGSLLLLLSSNFLLSAADGRAHVSGRLLAGYREGVDPSLVERTFSGHGALVRRKLPDLRLAVLAVPEASSEAVLQSLERTGLFDYVERDYYAHTAGIPDDPSYGSQWHLPRIRSVEAWGVTTGSASVVVAVIDSGVYGQHPDLISKLVPG